MRVAIAWRARDDWSIRACADLLDDRVDRYLRMGSVRGLNRSEPGQRTKKGWEDPDLASADYRVSGAVRDPSVQAMVTNAGSESDFILRII